jgi:50S ribosomal protein L16 3-hydroxylase
MLAFAQQALQAALKDPQAVARAVGEYLSEPKANVWFDGGDDALPQGGVRLDRKTRMLYDEKHVFINGEGFLAAGRDARLMRQLADSRHLSAKEVASLGTQARALLDDWCAVGWVLPDA